MAVINITNDQLITLKGALQALSDFYYDETRRLWPGTEEHTIMLEESNKVDELLQLVFNAAPIEMAT